MKIAADRLDLVHPGGNLGADHLWPHGPQVFHLLKRGIDREIGGVYINVAIRSIEIIQDRKDFAVLLSARRVGLDGYEGNVGFQAKY